MPIKINEPLYDKTNKMTYAPSKDSDQSGIRPVWSVFAVRMKKHTHRALSWSESLLGTRHFVGLSCGGSDGRKLKIALWFLGSAFA